jgi:hypothetical protein
VQRSYDLSSTTYSPDGKVFQIEYAAKAVDASGCVRVLRARARCGRRCAAQPRANPRALCVRVRSRVRLALRSTAVGIKCKDGVVLVRSARRYAQQRRTHTRTRADADISLFCVRCERAWRSWW